MSSSESNDAVADPSETLVNPNILQSDLITILVGAQQSKFLVHQEVLTKYHYFRKCLAGNFLEATSKEIKMPEDDPTIFAKVLEFIYFGTIPYHLDDEFLKPTAGQVALTDTKHERFSAASEGLVKVYQLADKLCMETLMNAIHDRYRTTHEYFAATIQDLVNLAVDGRKDSLLRQFALKHIVQCIRGYGWDRFKSISLCLWTYYMEQDPGNALELFELFARTDAEQNVGNPAGWKHKCQWHVHIDTPICDVG